MNRDHSVIFETASKYCILDSFVDCDGYSISSKGFLPIVVDIMVIWVKIHPFHSNLVLWFLKCWCSLLPSPVWPLPIYPDSWTYHSSSYAVLFFAASDFTSITSHIHNWVLFLHWLHLFILSRVILPLISSSILGTYWPGEFIFQGLTFFAFSYCSWGSQSKNTEVVCHSFLQWTTFCQNSPLWPIHLGWPYTAWFILSLS